MHVPRERTASAPFELVSRSEGNFPPPPSALHVRTRLSPRDERPDGRVRRRAHRFDGSDVGFEFGVVGARWKKKETSGAVWVTSKP